MMATMKRASVQRTSTKELISLVEQACLVAKDAATNLLDYIENSSKMALLAVRDCEKELDRMERLVDQKITSAITEVSESEARQLLACLKFIIDLERIGDLAWSVAQRLQALVVRRAADDNDIGGDRQRGRSARPHLPGFRKAGPPVPPPGCCSRIQNEQENLSLPL